MKSPIINGLSIAWLVFTILGAALKILHIGGSLIAPVCLSLSFLLSVVLLFLVFRKIMEV